MAEGIDELGPIDWIVVDLPGSKFNGEIALVNRRTDRRDRRRD